MPITGVIRLAALLFPVIFVAQSSSGCLTLSAEVEELTKTVSDEALSFAPGGDVAGQRIAVERSFELDLGHELLRFVASADLQQASFVPRVGIDDFAFVHRAEARLVNGEQGLPEVIIAELVAADQVDRRRLVLRINPEVDLGQYLSHEGTVCTVDLELDVPADAWAVDLQLSLRLGLEATFKP